MKIIGNILWLLLGGGLLAIAWAMAGLICCITIIGIPIGLQCFKFAGLVIWPFGKEIVYSDRTSSFLFNLLWVIIFGWELALLALIIGVVWCMTIIGIPFGLQSIKFAKLALMPFGAKVKIMQTNL